MTTSPDELIGDDILRRLEEDDEAVDLEKDMKRREIAREQAEDSEMQEQNDLPNVLPVSFSVLRGLGEEGPHRVFIPEWIDTGKVDEDGEAVYRLHVHKKKIAPFKLKVQLDASELLGQIHEETFRVSLAWSYQRGEGDLDPKVVANMLEKVYPKVIVNPMTGEQVERPEFTPEGIVTTVNGTLKDLSYDNLQAMVEVVHLALARFNPDITLEWIEETCDYSLLTRIIGKILYINSGLRDRFLA